MTNGNTNYSYATSHPAYSENPESKLIQEEQLLKTMIAIGGNACLKQLEEIMGLPQSTISGRMNDLMKRRAVMDTGSLIMYAGRRRKLFAIIPGPDFKKNVIPTQTKFIE